MGLASPQWHRGNRARSRGVASVVLIRSELQTKSPVIINLEPGPEVAARRLPPRPHTHTHTNTRPCGRDVFPPCVLPPSNFVAIAAKVIIIAGSLALRFAFAAAAATAAAFGGGRAG